MKARERGRRGRKTDRVGEKNGGRGRKKARGRMERTKEKGRDRERAL